MSVLSEAASDTHGGNNAFFLFLSLIFCYDKSIGITRFLR